MTYTFEAETGTRTITTVEEAKQSICATATVLLSTHEELRSHKEIQRMAKAFNLNTDDIEITLSEDLNELRWGYPHKFKFK